MVLILGRGRKGHKDTVLAAVARSPGRHTHNMVPNLRPALISHAEKVLPFGGTNPSLASSPLLWLGNCSLFSSKSSF